MQSLKNYIKRIFFRTEDEPFNVLMHPFMLYSFIYGLWFLVFPNVDDVRVLVLKRLTTSDLDHSVVNIWGALLMFAVIMIYANLMFRKKYFGDIGGTLALMLWIYAVIIEASGGFWFQAMISGIQVWFWIWHTFRISRYYSIF